jgi:hypothetical protein
MGEFNFLQEILTAILWSSKKQGNEGLHFSYFVQQELSPSPDLLVRILYDDVRYNL